MARSSFKKMVLWGAIFLLLVVVTIFVIKFFKLYEGAESKAKAKAKPKSRPKRKPKATAKATAQPQPQAPVNTECTRDQNTGKPSPNNQNPEVCSKDFCDPANEGRRYTCDINNQLYKHFGEEKFCPGDLRSNGTHCRSVRFEGASQPEAPGKCTFALQSGNINGKSYTYDCLNGFYIPSGPNGETCPKTYKYENGNCIK